MRVKKASHLTIVPDQATEKVLPSLIDVIAKLTLRNQEYFIDVLKMAMAALEEKDPYTKGHSVRVAEFSVQIGRELGLAQQDLQDLELIALLHDIGKIGIPDKVLKKPGRLNAQEYQIMQEHSAKGESILSEITGLSHLKSFVRSHHERIDGFGYPDGLKGDEIPLFSRIILIADTYDAMTSTRPYRKGLSQEVCFQELKKCSGTQFDTELTNIFIASFDKDKKSKAA